MNIHKLTDVKKTIDERAATFDGAMHHSVMCGSPLTSEGVLGVVLMAAIGTAWMISCTRRSKRGMLI